MKTSKSYSDLVTQAEQAVAAVKDPELRKVAFEKVLDDLLSITDETANPTPKAAGTHTTLPRETKPKAASVSKTKQGGPKQYIEDMVTDGFFTKPQTIAAIRTELQNRGHHIPVTSLSGPLQRLCQEKSLRRQKTDGTFEYSKW